MAGPTPFDLWLGERYREGGAFTMLIVLVRIGELEVDLLRSTHLHVIGDETSWRELTRLFEGAKVPWNGAAFFEADPVAGLVEDPNAKLLLSDLVARLHENRLVLNDGHFFDKQGRRLRIDEATAH